MMSHLKCWANLMLNAVFPMAVGPTIVIKYFIDDFLAPTATETPQWKTFAFAGGRQRPTEAGRLTLQMQCFQQGVEVNGGNSYKLLSSSSLVPHL
jgi:hypothetical protein